jgi:two-component system chemotaxis response regulator CheB
MHHIDEPKFVVVVGASAGGLNSVIELCAQLTKEMNVAVFVVLHISHISMSDILVDRIQKSSSLTCKSAEHDESIRANHIYLAVPDSHLVMKDHKIVLGNGPAENRWRPSIDVLFRSAAASFGNRAIGVVLSGMLHDGTSGMIAIQRSGGTSIVQDPLEADYPDMPQSVLDNMKVDYCVSISQMGAIIKEKTRNGLPPDVDVPEDVKAEAEISQRVAVGIENVNGLGERSLFSCPDCGGALWELEQNGRSRYRCHTGHAYSDQDLFLRMDENTENTLWIALRMLDERKALLQKMSAEELSKGWIRSAANKRKRTEELEEHIERLKQLLFDTRKNEESRTG